MDVLCYRQIMVGWLVSLSRDFLEYVAVQIPGAAEEVEQHCKRMEIERGNTGYGWVRTSSCCDEEGGVYLSSVDHLHQVVWNGKEFSFDGKDGALNIEMKLETARAQLLL